MSNCPSNAIEIENYREGKVGEEHRIDCLILLGYSILLILALITVWIFKHKKLRFVHETGFSLIYGILLGVILYYGFPNQRNSSVNLNLPPIKVSNCTNQFPPDDIILNMKLNPMSNNTESLSFAYAYQHSVKGMKYIKQLGTKATFDSEIFFNLLLPPIIFCAGYSMKRKHFFENLGAITTFAFMGTILSAFSIGGLCYGFSRLVGSISHIGFKDCLMFGSFVSATDPVTVLAIFNDLAVEVNLYALVFGESVLNDAVAIVMAESVEKYGTGMTDGSFSGYEVLMSIKMFVSVFLGALGIGCFVGVITALLTKYTYIREHPLLETALFCMMSYCSFLGAEAAGLSGIVASLFCGITQAHYTYNNLSEESQKGTKEIIELLSLLAENFVFVYIGVSIITFQEQNWNISFIFISLFSIIVGRAINIYVLSAILNLGRTQKIDCRYQNMLMFAGLRGAMAYALSIRNTSTDIRQMFFTSTVVIVMITVFLCGGFTKPMISWLNIRMGKDIISTATTPEPINDRNVQSDQILDSEQRHKKKAIIMRMFSKLDCKYIKPFLTHSPPLLLESCPQCCLPFTELCTTSEQFSQNAKLHASENNFSLNSTSNVRGAGDINPAFKADNSFSGSGVSKLEVDVKEIKLDTDLTGHYKRRDRDSDLELILSDNDDDNSGYVEADESGLYIQVPRYEK